MPARSNLPSVNYATTQSDSVTATGANDSAVAEAYPPSLMGAVAASTQDEHGTRVSVVIPCLNEAETIAECVTSARAVLEESGLRGEVIVVDNASDDGSGDIARAAGATVVYEPRRGYGSAYLAGLAAAQGDYIVMADADLTYDFREIPAFVRELDAGAQLVVGNRLKGIQAGAMPFLSRIGNPILSGFLNVLYRTNVGDVHCGMRALRRDALPVLNLRATGMEFASEMVIRAAREKFDVREIPIELHPRVGESKLSPLRDGWRHLRLMLVYNPNFLFTLPGAVMAVVGLAVRDRRVCTRSSLWQGPVHPFADPRLPARHPRRAGDELRHLRTRVQRVLHRRRGSLFRPCAGAAAARARSRRGGRVPNRRSRALRRAARIVGLARLRSAAGGAAVRRGADRDRGGCADLLHVVSALRHRPSPSRLRLAPRSGSWSWRHAPHRLTH